MNACLFVAKLLLILSLTVEVKGARKSTAGDSLRSKATKTRLCRSCKVSRKVETQTVNHGKKVTMKCGFKGISPKNITWFKDGRRVRETGRFTISFIKNGLKLKIRRVSAKDSGQYRCVGRNVQGLEISTDGYLRVKRGGGPKQRVNPRLTFLPRMSITGKCELYRGKICSPYIGQNTLIFVNVQERENNQDFIEKKLSFGNKAISQKLSNSCRSYFLPFSCHYHFPECSVINIRSEPKRICRNECEHIKKTHCKSEYDVADKGGSSSSEDDLFPNCKLLPKESGKGKCVSLSRHNLQDLLPKPDHKHGRMASGENSQLYSDPKRGSESGRCSVYGGKICKMKIGKKVFLPVGVTEADLENEIARTQQKTSGLVSKQCQPFVLPLLCQLKFPDCDDSSDTPKAKPICKDECLVLKDRYCKKEYISAQKSGDSGLIFDCSSIQGFNRNSGKCSVIGVPTKDLKGPHGVDLETTAVAPRVGICTPYQGKICKKYLDTKRTIFLDHDNSQGNVERKLSTAIKAINSYPKLSSKCKPFILPVICHHLFPYCEPSPGSQPKPSYICRKDCLHIQHNFCPAENEVAEREFLIGSLLVFPRCLDLSKSADGCISLRRYFNQNKTGRILGDCYGGRGGDYRGFANVTESGITCQRWDKGDPHLHFLIGTNKNPELRGGHNYCRNPGGKRKKPWCFTMDPERHFEFCSIRPCVNAPINGSGVDYLGTVNRTLFGKLCEPWSKHEPKLNWGHNYCRNPNGSDKLRPWCYTDEEGSWDYCDVPTKKEQTYPGKKGHLSNLLYTVIPCVLFGLVIGVAIIAFCWKQHKQGPHSMKKNSRVTVTVFLPELKTIPAENILLSKFIGNGRFSALYSGEIHSEDCNRVPATRLIKVALKESGEEFMKQAKIWSQFHHPNILTVEAISSGNNPVTLVFEPAGHGSLYQYLIHHSPNNPNFTRDHALLNNANLLDISRQIAAGMTYLSSHDYVHGDLMTRNCQVAHSMIIKITDFSIDRDACYYRQPNKPPTPLGWMAPETISTDAFTTYSDVWAFGVVLWEIFTYGFQPYFGYTYSEVKKKISDMELLERPRDCLPFVYDLMRRCWIKDPLLRPHFCDLHEHLNSLSDEIFAEEEEKHSFIAPSSC